MEGKGIERLDIEVLEIGEIPAQIREILTDVDIKYGYLIFGNTAIKFPEPPIEIAKRIIEKWNEVLNSIYKEIVEEYKRVLGKKNLGTEDLEKLGIVLGRLPEVELRRHIGKYEKDIKEIISYIIGEKLAEQYFPKMTIQQMFYNIYSILTLVLYSTPLHQLIMEQQKRMKELKNKNNLTNNTYKENIKDNKSGEETGQGEQETNPFLT